jgi:hypothetical protein
MSVTIYPNTSTGHVGLVDDGGRQYIVDRSLAPEVAQVADGARPDPALLNPAVFLPDDGRLLITGIEPDGQVEAEGIPHDLRLNPTEIATLAQALGSA